MHDIVGFSSVHKNSTASTNLGALAATVRAGVAAMGCAMTDVFCHAFEVGHALIEAQTHVGHGRWQSWVLAECGLSLRSASDYMRIARHEEFLKAEIGSSAADWSLRGALRAIGGRSRRGGHRPRSPLSILDWRAATLDQRTTYLARIPIREWLAALSREQRLELEDRIDGLRAAQAKPIAAVTHH